MCVSTYPLSLSAVQCWLLCSPAPSKRKKEKEKILNAEVFGTAASAASTASFSPSALCFSSLLVGVPANFSHIKVAGDKTGCHRFACNVSWAWFLLWAGSAAQHFYSNPPKTIPCVMWPRNESVQKLFKCEAPMYANPGPLSGVCPAVHQDTTSFTFQEQGLAERTREDISAPPSPSLPG